MRKTYSDYSVRRAGGQLFTIANRPLPSSKNPHFQNEAKCTNEFCLHENEKSFAYQRRFGTDAQGTRKWPIEIPG